jgi:L-ascorbate metabolism protein UlaG (beta-lactamase superfamily)
VNAPILRKTMHPRRKDYIGYYLTMPNGISVYHAGDTHFMPEMMNLKPDIAMIPVGGGTTMNWEEALRAMGAIGARITIPIHYGLIPFSAAGAKKFLARGGGSAKELP